VGAYVRACVCVGSRARLRVHTRARVFPYLSNMQNACAVLHFRVSSLAPPHFLILVPWYLVNALMMTS
jgi:hypothetical protein